MRTKNIPDYGDVFTLSEFLDMMDCGAVGAYDGSAYPSNGIVMSTKEISLFRGFEKHLPKGTTHIVWFNK